MSDSDDDSDNFNFQSKTDFDANKEKEEQLLPMTSILKHYQRYVILFTMIFKKMIFLTINLLGEHPLQ